MRGYAATRSRSNHLDAYFIWTIEGGGVLRKFCRASNPNRRAGELEVGFRRHLPFYSFYDFSITGVVRLDFYSAQIGGDSGMG